MDLLSPTAISSIFAAKVVLALVCFFAFIVMLIISFPANASVENIRLLIGLVLDPKAKEMGVFPSREP